MLEAVTDKFVLKSLEKYGARLDTFISMDPELKDKEPGKTKFRAEIHLASLPQFSPLA